MIAPLKLKFIIQLHKNLIYQAVAPLARLRQDKAKPCPIIVWSHGLGGSVDGAAFLSRYIASHGYVIVHVQHYGTDSSLWEGKDGHPWDIIRDTKISRAATLNRYKDIPFALDQLSGWLDQYPEIKEIADLSTIGYVRPFFWRADSASDGGDVFS